MKRLRLSNNFAFQSKKQAVFLSAFFILAYENKDFVCIKTAQTLFALMDRYAREEDTLTVIEQFAYITGISLNGD